MAIAECCISKGGRENIGAKIDMDDDMRPDILLFGETQSRIVITVEQGRITDIEMQARDMDVPCRVIGRVGGESLIIRHNSSVLIDTPVPELEEVWRRAIPKYIGEEGS